MEEKPAAPPPIQGLPTETAAFVGLAEKGPTRPRLVSSLSEFRSIYGPPCPESHLAPAARSFFENGGRRLYVSRVVPSADTAQVADYLGDPAAPPEERTGLAALEALDDVSLLAVPDEVRREPVDLTPLTDAVLDQCERRRDRLAIVSTLAGMRNPRDLPPRRDTSYGAFYYPWIEVPADEGATRLVPPSGAVAGVIARSEREHGVHKAPANEPLRGVVGLEFPVTTAMVEVLNPRGVNTLRPFEGRGIRVWGARTMSSDSEWKYVPVRRYAIFLERSIEKGTEWAVFEPNDEPLWARVRRQVEDFLIGELRRGAFAGTKPSEAFFVRCDRSTMTAADIERGRLIVLVGFAPLRPAEFVVVRIQQLAGQPRT